MRPIDADVLDTAIYEDLPLKYFTARNMDKAYKNMEHLREIIGQQPTIDAVPVVRCYQCRHWYKGHCAEKQIATVKTDPQFYCANGEDKA